MVCPQSRSHIDNARTDNRRHSRPQRALARSSHRPLASKRTRRPHGLMPSRTFISSSSPARPSRVSQSTAKWRTHLPRSAPVPPAPALVSLVTCARPAPPPQLPCTYAGETAARFVRNERDALAASVGCEDYGLWRRRHREKWLRNNTRSAICRPRDICRAGADGGSGSW